LQSQRVRKAILEAGFDYTDFSRWVKDQLILPLNTVRQLPRILADDKSRFIFLSDGAQEAIKVLDTRARNSGIPAASLGVIATASYSA
jgi:hypothetical protein